jgi:hypothetical protein
MLNVLEVKVRGEYRLWLRFNDGSAGEIDLREHLIGPVFEPLQDPATFATVQLDPEIRTIAWPNGADFAPEFLHGLLNSRVPAL